MSNFDNILEELHEEEKQNNLIYMIKKIGNDIDIISTQNNNHIDKIKCINIYSVNNNIDNLIISKYPDIYYIDHKKDNNTITIINNKIKTMNIYYDMSDWDDEDHELMHNYYNIFISNSTIEELIIDYYKINNYCHNNIIIENSNIKTLKFINCKTEHYPNKYNLDKKQNNKYMINVNNSIIDYFYIDNYKIRRDGCYNYYKSNSFNIKKCIIKKLQLNETQFFNMHIKNNQIKQFIFDDYDNDKEFNIIKSNNNINDYVFNDGIFNLYENNNYYNIEEILNNKKVIIKHNYNDLNKNDYTNIKINNYDIYYNNNEVIIIY